MVSVCRYRKRKVAVEDCLSISIFTLYRNNCLNSNSSGEISWTCQENKNSIGYRIQIYGDVRILDFKYVCNVNQGTFPITISFPVVKSRCHYGGFRYWFLCGCEKRVAVLYKPVDSNHFACRHCFNLTYKSRNLGGNYKKLGRLIPFQELIIFESSIKRILYDGKFTRKYKKLLKERDRLQAIYDIVKIGYNGGRKIWKEKKKYLIKNKKN